MKNNYTEQLNNKLKTPMLEDIITLNDVYSHRLLKSILDGSLHPLVNDSTSREMIAHAATFSLFYSQSTPCFKEGWLTIGNIEKVEDLLYKMLNEGLPFDRSMTDDATIVNTFELILCDAKSLKKDEIRQNSCFIK